MTERTACAKEGARLSKSRHFAGERLLNPSLTIVLPVHNGESRLTGCVGEILELASELTPDFNVLIVDDGSTDDTYSTAEELSARYPQVTVRRHQQQRGLGPTLELVRRRVRSDVVIVHDGVSAIDPNQVRSLWRDQVSRQTAKSDRKRAATNEDASALADAAKTHRALARTHGRLLGFQLLSPETSGNERRETSLDDVEERSNRPAMGASPRPKAGVGQIPSLPRPKFLSAIAQFALGE